MATFYLVKLKKFGSRIMFFYYLDVGISAVNQIFSLGYYCLNVNQILLSTQLGLFCLKIIHQYRDFLLETVYPFISLL